jgi:Carboxypeptidase regulatory-like domain
LDYLLFQIRGKVRVKRRKILSFKGAIHCGAVVSITREMDLNTGLPLCLSRHGHVLFTNWRDSTMKRFLGALLALFLLVTATQAFSQSSNANLSGTVTDPSGGVLPGVTITATNTATGVVMTVVSNSAGVYNFASLLPGVYKVSAEMKGFQTRTFTDVQLGNAAQVRINIKLDVGQIQETVEVSVAGDRLLLESSSSVGDVLPENEVRQLPLTSQNVLDLSKVMGGVIQTNDAIFGEGMGLGGGGTTFAGVSPAMVNVQRDGIPMSDVRWPTGSR